MVPNSFPSMKALLGCFIMRNPIFFIILSLFLYFFNFSANLLYRDDIYHAIFFLFFNHHNQPRILIKKNCSKPQSEFSSAFYHKVYKIYS